MKKTIYSIIMCLALAASAAFTSCSEDMPNVNYVNVVSNTSDFSKVIEAIKSQTTTLAEKLDLVNQTLADTNTKLADKLKLIEEAVNAGVATYEELAKKLIDSINALEDTQEKKLQAIIEILGNTNASLDQKLADIEAAIKAGIGSYELYSQQLIDAIDAMNVSQAEKLQLIYDILKSELATLSQKVADVNAAIEKGFLDNAAALEALSAAIVDQLNDNNTDLAARLVEIKDAIEAINTSIDDGFTLENDALVALSNQLLAAIADNANSEAYKIELLADAIETLAGNIEDSKAELITLLEELKDAVEKRTDYSGIIAAIRSLLGPEYVDLGLSVKWAKWNVGAKSETDYGDKFAWGETAPKTEYTEGNYKWGIYNGDDPNKGMTKYNKIDGLETLQPEDDAATANWGDDWRTPTVDEFYELEDNCDWTWTTKKDAKGNDVNGYTVTSKKNGNSIFLPATKLSGAIDWYDNYWSSTLYKYNVGCAYDLFFSSETYSANLSHGRELGFVVRPVLKPSSER